MTKNISWALTGFCFAFFMMVTKEGFSLASMLSALVIGIVCAALLALLSAFGWVRHEQPKQSRKHLP